MIPSQTNTGDYTSASQVASTEAEVLVYVGEECVAKYSIVPGDYLIGRDKSCQINIEAEGVSRHHARLTFQGYELVLEDMGSANGFFIEGTRVQLPTRVRRDQQVEIGSARLFFRLKEQASALLAAALWDPELGLAPIRAMLVGKKYKTLAAIGRGGMGVVNQARDLRIRRTVAIKVIKTADQSSRENVMRFVAEAQITGQLQHPNIIPVYDLGVDEHGEVFYTMKFLKGITLEDVLKGIRKGDEEVIKKYPLSAILTMFQKICDAVAFAHSKGVVHRDLKPENVMIGEYGEVMVMDWGLSKHLSDVGHEEAGVASQKTVLRASETSQTSLVPPPPPPRNAPLQSQVSMPPDSKVPDRGFQTMNGLIVGSPPFIAPETARGELDKIDPRTDIYVLGSILYTLLTLRAPYLGKEFGELINQIVSGKFVPLADYNIVVKKPGKKPSKPLQSPDGRMIPLLHLPGKRIPEGLVAIVNKAMSYKPEDRYQKVEDFQAEIQAWQSGFAPKAEGAGFWRHIRLWAEQNKANVVVSCVVSLFLLSAVIYLFVALSNARTRAMEREQEAVKQAKASFDDQQQFKQAYAELRKKMEAINSVAPVAPAPAPAPQPPPKTVSPR